MNKYVKILFGFLLCVIVILSSVACTNPDEDEDGGNGNQDEQFLTQEQVKKSLTNYSFKYQSSYYDGTKTTIVNIVDMRNEDAWQYGFGEVIFLANIKTTSLYMLNTEDKTGMLTKLDEEMTSFSNWGTYLFGWYENVSSFKKVGTDKVVNRMCNVYEFSFGTIKYTYYIDRQYDLCLKYEIFESSSNVKTTFTFTEFKMGGVKTEEILAVLEGYTIDDYRNIFS